jgi:hypothetical protein
MGRSVDGESGPRTHTGGWPEFPERIWEFSVRAQPAKEGPTERPRTRELPSCPPWLGCVDYLMAAFENAGVFGLLHLSGLARSGPSGRVRAWSCGQVRFVVYA